MACRESDLRGLAIFATRGRDGIPQLRDASTFTAPRALNHRADSPWIASFEKENVSNAEFAYSANC